MPDIDGFRFGKLIAVLQRLEKHLDERGEGPDIRAAREDLKRVFSLLGIAVEGNGG